MKQLILASFKQRQRRSGFYFALIAFMLLPIFFTPQADAPFKVMLIEHETFNQADNPTWLPITSAIIFGFFLIIFGFSFILNAYRSDQENGVWDWLFTTQFLRVRYAFSKFIANILLLLCLLGATIIGTLLMLLLRFPGQGINLWLLTSSYLMLIPGIILIAAFAVFIEALTSRYNTWILSLSTLFLLIVYSFQDSYPTVWWAKLTSIGGINYGLSTISNSVKAAIGHSTSSISFFSEYAGNTNKPSLYLLPVDFSGNTSVLMLGEVVIACLVATISTFLIRRSRLTNGSTKSKLKLHREKKVLPTIQVANYQTVSGKAPIFLLRFFGIELKRQLFSISKLNLVSLVISWILLWGSSADTQQFLWFPLASLLFLPFFSQLGVDHYGFTEWLKTFDQGFKLKKGTELVVSNVLSLVLVFPVMVKNPTSVIQVLLFATAQVCLAEGMGTLFNNSRFITSFLTIFWFLYLNGMSMFLDLGHFNISLILIYGTMTVIGILMTFQKIIFTRKNK
ncbi:hypothetical protein [Pediococcus pentosaceus]|uniref:hypothetical protein n=1 Tax=Pediococcus pentosaceus TaxID=1255 RepID=UPI0021A6E8A1|nr:hypothetical protein [Pediococcus pentosaceus]MCT3033275.1 hypothetical protein [Pediococcus pentosaceus]